MADLTKLKRRSSLGSPPPLAEASPNLDAPETAPPLEPPVPSDRRMAFVQPAAVWLGEEAPRRDGRSARRSGRTLQFATRVSPEFDNRLRLIAERDRKLLVEVLEDALEAYEHSRQKQSAR
jgi:hypothetical protein